MSVNDGWSPSLLIGIKSIDDEHRSVFAAIDGLLDALRHGYAEQEVVSTLNTLETYTSDHFRAEETLMRQHGYPNLPDHAAAHAAFKARLKELLQMHQQSGTSKALAVQTSQAIGKLLILDIETHDRKMAAFLTSNGKVS